MVGMIFFKLRDFFSIQFPKSLSQPKSPPTILGDSLLRFLIQRINIPQRIDVRRVHESSSGARKFGLRVRNFSTKRNSTPKEGMISGVEFRPVEILRALMVAALAALVVLARWAIL